MLARVIVVAAVVVVLVACVAARRVDGNVLTACALTLIPYAVACGLLAGAVTLALGMWWTAGTLLVSSVVLGADLVPRLVPAREPTPDGRRVRVLAANLLFGRADVKAVVELVRAHEVDVLNVVELTAEWADELARAGLTDLLPYQILQPAPNGVGSGVLSRYPLTELDLAGPTRLAHPSARVDLGDMSVEVVAVHPVPPTDSASGWRTDLSYLPPPGEPIRILAGDFNATPDHAAFRRLLRAGYHDAGLQRGAALVPTWSLGERVPLFTLDHVLVDPRAHVASYRVFDVPGSDHKAVYAELVLTPR